MTVIDAGAGHGTMTRHAACQVRPGGGVHATDIDPDALQVLPDAVARESARGAPALGVASRRAWSPARGRLPAASADLVIMLRVPTFRRQDRARDVAYARRFQRLLAGAVLARPDHRVPAPCGLIANGPIVFSIVCGPTRPSNGPVLRPLRIAALVATVTLGGCPDVVLPWTDAVAVDGGNDAAPADAGSPDVGSPDVGSPDAGPSDVGVQTDATDTRPSEVSGDAAADASVDATLDAAFDVDSGSATDLGATADSDAAAEVEAGAGDADGAEVTDALTLEDIGPLPDGDASGSDVPADAAVEVDAGPIIGPFDDLEGLAGDDLRAALLERIAGHTSLGYGGDGWAREYMWAVLDAHDGRVECVYTARTIEAENPNAPPIGDDTTLPPIPTTVTTDCRMPDGTPVAQGCLFNTEHSWPKSEGASVEPALSDLHHLFPSYEVANGYRGDHYFGDTTCSNFGCTWDENGSELGNAVGGYQAFEVRAPRRGDIARAQFYFSVRYGQAIPPDVEDDLRAWHAADPPDDRELARNEGIFAVQGNHNPFVSRPDFVALIPDF